MTDDIGKLPTIPGMIVAVYEEVRKGFETLGKQIDGKQIAGSSFEQRLAALEKQAELFEKHRQEWIGMNEGLKKFNEEWDADSARWKKREQNEKNSQSLYSRITSPQRQFMKLWSEGYYSRRSIRTPEDWLFAALLRMVMESRVKNRDLSKNELRQKQAQ
jgi:hypothetical protein